ncbi:Aldo/keto reductase [Dentipellis sp. KUC8613]|nr:Aldo/keto reductase [Dentipellis sp. KUC8613]
MSQPTRKIGGVTVPAIGFGAMGLSAAYGDVPSDEERLKFLDAVYERGCTHWDTADVYLDNEELIGKWFALHPERRQHIFLATKFGQGDYTRGGPNGEPEYVKSSLETSLKRLQTNYVDLFYLHRADPKVPIEKTVGAMAELVKAGKVRHLGLSEVSAATLRRAHAVHPIAALQVEYSAIWLDIESPEIGLLKTARELGITVVAYSPLGRGLLTGQYRTPADLPAGDFRSMIPRFSDPANFPRINALADALKEIGTAHGGATAGQVALAWILAQGDDIATIPGTKKLKYLDENLGANKVVLSVAEVAKIRKLAEDTNKTVTGERYPPGQVERLFVDTPPL